MLNAKKLNFIGKILLLSATLLWGTSFILLKQTINDVPMHFVIAVRFLISSLFLGIIFFKKIIKLNKKVFSHGIILCLILALAYITQTYGLKLSTASRNAFITSSYCIMCPFLVWAFAKKRPDIYNFISTIVCLVGIGLIVLSNGKDNVGGIIWGDFLTLVGALFFALQIVFIDRFRNSGDDPIGLIFSELLTVGVIFSFLCLVIEVPNPNCNFSLSTEQILKILYLALGCTLLAQTFQLVGQKYVQPTQVSIILSLEAVFGVVFSVILGEEKMSPLLIIGFVIVFIAIIISETKPNFARLLGRNEKKE